MKKNIIVLAALIFLSAIPTLAGDFKIGLSAGFDLANTHVTNQDVIGNDVLGYYPMPSYNINGYLGYKGDGRIGWSIEPGYIKKGGEKKDDLAYYGEDSRYELNYVQVPILAEIYLTKRLFVSAGPELAFLAKANVVNSGNSYKVEFLYDNKLEVSGLLGVNYNLFKWLDVGVRYNHGIMYTNSITYTDETGSELGEGKEYNQYLQFMVRVKI